MGWTPNLGKAWLIRMAKRTISTEFTAEDAKLEPTLRPQRLTDYIGQQKIKENLAIYIEAAKKRQDPLDHVLFYGPPGLGKTTLAGIIANEMQVNMKVTSGPAIEKPGEMAAILNNLKEGDVLFVDEIHRLNRQVEEVLYPAMEDFAIDIMLGKESSARSIRLELPHFTLVGATTRAGLLSAPLRDRFGVVQRMEFYTPEELRTADLVQTHRDLIEAWRPAPLEVAAAMLMRGQTVLLCRRPAGKARALQWEFPGGKLEPGETGEQALARECREELGAEVRVGPRVDELVFNYPDLSVHLTLYQAEPLTEPRALEHSALEWAAPSELAQYDLCPADRRFVPAVQQWFSEQEKAPAQQAAQRPQTGE